MGLISLQYPYTIKAFDKAFFNYKCKKNAFVLQLST